MMGTGHMPREEPGIAPGESPEAEHESQSGRTLDSDSEKLMEMLLAACLAMPRPRLDSAIDEACFRHPHLAPHLRHRYVNLLQMGILEQHEKEEGLSGESTA